MGTTPAVLMTSKNLIAVARVAGGELMPLMTKLGYKPYCTTSFPSGRNYHKWTADAYTAVKNWRAEKDKTYNQQQAIEPVTVALEPLTPVSPISQALEDVNNMLINQDKEDTAKQVLQYLELIDMKLKMLLDVWKK
jgi:hypothetical protein